MRVPKLSQTATDLLLDGATGSTPLHRVLAAARRPAEADEIAGTAAVHAAFLAAVVADPDRACPRRSARVRSVRSGVLSRLLAAKALAALVLGVGATGVAVAATATVTADRTQGTVDQHSAADPRTGASGSARVPRVSPTPTDDARPEGERHASIPAIPDVGAAMSTASIEALCRAWAAQAAGDPAAAAALAAQAGGADRVPAFCARQAPIPPGMPGQPTAPTPTGSSRGSADAGSSRGSADAGSSRGSADAGSSRGSADTGSSRGSADTGTARGEASTARREAETARGSAPGAPGDAEDWEPPAAAVAEDYAYGPR